MNCLVLELAVVDEEGNRKVLFTSNQRYVLAVEFLETLTSLLNKAKGTHNDQA